MVRKITLYEWTQLMRNELGRLGNEDVKSFLVDLNRRMEDLEEDREMELEKGRKITEVK